MSRAGSAARAYAKLHAALCCVAPQAFAGGGKPVWGTCAGLIFLANRATGVKEGGQALLGGLDVTVHRNFFGAQVGGRRAGVSQGGQQRAGSMHQGCGQRGPGCGGRAASHPLPLARLQYGRAGTA